MKTFDTLLEDLATRALPGGVTAAAMAAAMGAALVAKAAQTTLRRQALPPSDQQQLEALVELAKEHRTQLLRLAAEDERAYRAVLGTRDLAPDAEERRRAWLQATGVPLRVAEVCHGLLLCLNLLADRCWPAIVTDLRIGRRLLAAGLDSGIEAAEENLRSLGEDAEARNLRSRMDVLRGEA